MIHWHSRIYLGEGLNEKYENICSDIESGKTYPDVYIISLSSNPAEQLDIYSSYMFVSDLKLYPDRVVVGLANSKEEARELVAVMAYEALSFEGKVDFRSYFK